MTLTFGLFRNEPSYEGGNSNVYVKNNYFMNAVYTEALHAARSQSSITNIYDGDSTSIYYTIGGTVTTIWMKWDFGKRVEFKNIYVIAHSNVGSGSTNTTIIYGSNNDTDWTEIGTVVITATGAATAIATNVRYRYYKVTQAKGSATGDAGIAQIMGVLD